MDPCHTTTGLSADQMIRFARVVGLEVTLAAFGLQHFLLHAREISRVGSRGDMRRSPFPRSFAPTKLNSIASELK